MTFDNDQEQLIKSWLDDDEEMRVPGNRWGTSFYAAITDLLNEQIRDRQK